MSTEFATSENTSSESTPSTRFNILVAVVIALLAVVAALITKFESDASTMSGLAGSEEQIYYYQAMGAQISGDADTNYEFGTAYQLWYKYDLLYKGALQRGDQESADTYQGLRNELTSTSALLQAPYFNPETGQINLPRYKADRYTTRIIELQENQLAASNVSSAWGDKSGAYVLQLTLLAVAGFLLGLALMTKARVARLVFAGSGIPMMVVISVWAYHLSVQPVFDLRETGAIPYFAQGVAQSDQNNWEEALKEFSRAIELAGADHPYASAYIKRAVVHSELGDFAAAVSDYEVAVAEGASDANAAGGLVWALFQEGRYAEAVQVGQKALERAPDQLWLRHRVSMALLASGDVEAAREEYQRMLDTATQQINNEKALGGTGSAILWQLKEASTQLEQLATLLEGDSASPIIAVTGKNNSVAQVARELSEHLLTASVALEFGQDMAAAKVDASISPLKFKLLQTDDNRYVYRVDALFDFEGLQPGQLLTIKVFRGGVEELAWEFSEPWTQDSSGMATIPLSPAYADVYAIAPGTYQVKVYLNGQLIQQSGFTVEGEENLFTQESGQPDAFQDMYAAYEFDSLDIFYTDGYEDDYWYYGDDLYFFEDFADDWYAYYYVNLWWDYGYYDGGQESYWVCDPDFDSYCSADYTFVCDPEFDSDCVIYDSNSQYVCDPSDPYCDTSTYTCDPDIDPECDAYEDSSDGAYCDPEIDLNCTTDGYVCDPDVDPYCTTDEYACDPYTDPNCDGYEDPYGEGEDVYCDPNVDPYCDGYEDTESYDYCDPYVDPYCADDSYDDTFDDPDYDDPYYDDEYVEEDPPPDEYYCDPDYDPDCY